MNLHDKIRAQFIRGFQEKIAQKFPNNLAYQYPGTQPPVTPMPQTMGAQPMPMQQAPTLPVPPSAYTPGAAPISQPMYSAGMAPIPPPVSPAALMPQYSVMEQTPAAGPDLSALLQSPGVMKILSKDILAKLLSGR